MRPMPIVMYGADWCGDCRRAKSVFAEHGVAYQYIDLDAEPDQVSNVLERNDGVRRIPVIVFDDDTHLVEPTNEALAANLASLTAPSPSVSNNLTFEVIERPEAGRFELFADGELVGFANYTTQDQSVVVPHVETLLPFRNQGFADRLMSLMLARLRETERTLTPLCSFASQYMREHPEQKDLLAF